MEAPVSSLLALSLAWLAYGSLHSLLASRTVKARCQALVPALMPGYRAAYNLTAFLTLLPLFWLLWRHPGPWLWQWQGWTAWPMNGVALLALALLVAGPGSYDLKEFLGIRQLVDRRPEGEDREAFRISVLHRYVRHPWYALSLVILWTRDMSAALLVSACWITAYLLVGSQLEEHKLISRFGQAYRDYRAQVPGFVPRPWRALSAEAAQRLEDAGCAG